LLTPAQRELNCENSRAYRFGYRFDWDTETRKAREILRNLMEDDPEELLSLKKARENAAAIPVQRMQAKRAGLVLFFLISSLTFAN
jgi:hypothetical protein